MSTTVKKHKQIIPTYIPKKPNDLPMFFENKPYQGASGRLYPIPYSDGITDEKTDVEYEAYTIENEYIKTVLLPEIGGKLLRGYDKVGEHDFIYYNEVVKPALVGLAGAWISGGIEFNWPQHHRPTTFMPVEAKIDENPDGSKTVWMGEVEPFNRMKGMVGITLDEGRSYIKAKVRLYNRTALPQVFMWWANLAVPANNNYRTVFPPDCEWVNDHDRRAILEWPIAKGVYKTARPYDFGDGTDLSKYSAVKVPSSYLISQGQSDMDFIAGYDTGIGKGLATVANHHISPGKKMWHWGIGDFGDMWCNNLTDENGPYIELMTGVFTDNQPDFTWIAPYESKEFEQYWYPIRDIGEIKNASIDAAVNTEMRDGGLFIGFNVTGEFKNAVVRVEDKCRTLFCDVCDMTPSTSYIRTVDIGDTDINEVTVSLLSSDGKTLVTYTPCVRGEKKPIEPRKPVARPCEIESIEELYINGYHLEQYKQHNYKPEDYYLEGLKRDDGDSRCNTAMARLSLKNGRFEDCVNYCNKAIKRLTLRNEHPTDTEALYLKGLALTYLCRDKEAYDTLYRAAWNYAHRSASLFELALLDCKAGEYTLALEKLEESAGLNYGHSMADNIKCAILRHTCDIGAEALARENVKKDPLDLFALIEYSHFADCKAELEQFIKKPENLIDVANVYIKAGLLEDAIETLRLFEGEYPLVEYYKAYLTKDGGFIEKAEGMDTGYCFPSRLEDIAVLKYAVENGGANASYYLGCLYYDRFRYDEAKDEWTRCVKLCDTHAKAWRNLALYWFDKADKSEKSKECLEKAMKHKDDPRLLFEYQQLLKNMGYTPEQRLAVYDKYPKLLAQRDDCYLDRLTLVSQTGRFEEAIELARVKRFHIYEGGEGKLTKQHAWMHVLYGKELMENGELEKAEKILYNGVNMPKSYGEAKTFFNQEAHIFYYLGSLFELQDKTDASKKAFEEAAVYKAAVSEISLFRALALKKIGKDKEADSVLEEMLSAAENFIKNCDLRTYYGVGSPSPMPFEYDIVKNNLTDGYILKAYALLGYGETDKARECIEKARDIRPYDFRIFAFDKIC